MVVGKKNFFEGFFPTLQGCPQTFPVDNPADGRTGKFYHHDNIVRAPSLLNVRDSVTRRISALPQKCSFTEFAGDCVEYPPSG